MFSHAVALPPKHKIKATECGEAHIGDDFRTLWGSVSCEKCLAKRPPPPVDKRAYEGPYRCRECLEVPSTCNVCWRCDQHCPVRKPNDQAAHESWLNPPLPAARKRKR
jgi:hypothetical protein